MEFGGRLFGCHSEPFGIPQGKLREESPLPFGDSSAQHRRLTPPEGAWRPAFGGRSLPTGTPSPRGRLWVGRERPNDGCRRYPTGGPLAPALPGGMTTHDVYLFPPLDAIAFSRSFSRMSNGNPYTAATLSNVSKEDSGQPTHAMRRVTNTEAVSRQRLSSSATVRSDSSDASGTSNRSFIPAIIV
jgi:hypothetical protein